MVRRVQSYLSERLLAYRTVVHRYGYQLIQNPRISGAWSVRGLGRDGVPRSARRKNRRAATRSRRSGGSTSITCPCWAGAQSRSTGRRPSRVSPG